MAWFSVMFVMLGICVAVSHGGTVAFGEGFVQTEAEEVHPDGTVVHLSKTSDVDCTFEQDTATLEDGYVSVILKDFTVGKSVLLDSKDPDVCYVRDIPKEEMAKHAKDCAGDHAAQKDDATADVGKTYVDGKELVEADLSDRLAEACKGRRLVALVQIVTAVGGAQPPVNLLPRRRRECRTVTETTCKPYKDCEQVCVKEGWWFRSGQCKRYEKMCDQKESCSRATTTTCDSA